MMNIRALNKMLQVVCKVIVLASFCMSAANAAAANKSSILSLYQNYENAQYAVRWSASAQNIAVAQAKMARYEYLVLYSSEQLLSASSSSVVQFGFFTSQKEASEFVSSNALAFPGAKVVSVSAGEHKMLFDVADPAAEQGSSNYFWLGPDAQSSNGSLKVLLKKAKAYYIQKNYTEALKYYGVLSLTQNPDTALWAREVMAVCYERLGELDKAAHVYRQLVGSYKDEPAGVRVTQRLRAIETAASDDKSPLKKASGKQESKSYWRGFVGQSYNQMDSSDGETDRNVLSALISNFDLHAGINANGHKVDVRLNGYDFYDMRDGVNEPNSSQDLGQSRYDNSDDSKTVIKRFYANYSHRSGINIIGGRQKDTDSGVYTSFDGASLRYTLGEHWTMGVSAGVPIYFSDFANYIDREFYSLHSAYDSNEHWSGSAYYTQQAFFGETERVAVGGKIRFLSKAFSGYLNIDYDLEFKELNILRWSGTYLFSKKSQATFNYGFQRSPFLSASNIQIGQPYRDVEAYIKREDFSYQEMLFDALDRTSIFEYASLSYQYRVDDDLQLITDLYHSTSSEIPLFLTDDNWQTSYVEAFDDDFTYSSVGLQVISYGFFGSNDTAIFSVRHNDTSTTTSNQIQLSERLRFGKKFFVKPKLSFRNVKRNGQESGQNKIRAGLALNYRPTRSAEIRFEVGSDADNDLELKRSTDTTYLIFGYQARF